MAKIFLIRHAESVANSKGIFQGQSYNSRLSKLGEKQAEALGKYLSKVVFDEVYSSPLTRAFRTADHVRRYQSMKRKIKLVDNLMETNHGDWEGIHKKKIEKKWPNLYETWLKKPSRVSFPKGERFTDTAKRVFTWFDKLILKKGTFAVVTHGNIVQILITHLKELSLDDMWKCIPQAASISLVVTESPVKIIYTGKASYLKDLKSDLKKQAI